MYKEASNKKVLENITPSVHSDYKYNFTIFRNHRFAYGGHL